MVAAKIGASLRKSKLTTAITLFHGSVTDKDMTAFLKGVAETEAPIRALHFRDMPYVNDKSWQLLPEIIKDKGITLCEFDTCNISPELKEEINIACGKNQNIENKGKGRDR